MKKDENILLMFIFRFKKLKEKLVMNIANNYYNVCEIRLVGMFIKSTVQRFMIFQSSRLML